MTFLNLKYPILQAPLGSIASIKKSETGAIETMSQWAGESVNGVKGVQPAADIVRELVDEAERLLRRCG